MDGDSKRVSREEGGVRTPNGVQWRIEVRKQGAEGSALSPESPAWSTRRTDSAPQTGRRQAVHSAVRHFGPGGHPEAATEPAVPIEPTSCRSFQNPQNAPFRGLNIGTHKLSRFSPKTRRPQVVIAILRPRDVILGHLKGTFPSGRLTRNRSGTTPHYAKRLCDLLFVEQIEPSPEAAAADCALSPRRSGYRSTV